MLQVLAPHSEHLQNIMLSSLLKTSSSITVHKTINAPPDQVLQVLHDPQILIKSNPLVSDFNQDPNDPSGYSYIVTDDLTMSFLGLSFKTTSRYRCTFAPREDGMDSDVSAGLGTKTSSHFTINDVHDQGRNEDSEGERSTQLVYVAEVEVRVVLAVYPGAYSNSFRHFGFSCHSS